MAIFKLAGGVASRLRTVLLPRLLHEMSRRRQRRRMSHIQYLSSSVWG